MFQTKSILAFLLFMSLLSACTAVAVCGTISGAGCYYLTADLTSVASTCLTVSASDVSIDGWDEVGVTGQHSITGDDTVSTVGILVNGNTVDVNISNVKSIIKYPTAIQYSASSNGTLNNNTINITSRAYVGIDLPNSNFTVINQTTINSSGGVSNSYDIRSAGGNNITVSNSKTWTSVNGIAVYITSGNNWTIKNNTFTSTSGTIQCVEIITSPSNDYATIINNSMSGCSQGIYIKSNFNTIVNNTISGSGTGIYMDGASSSNTIIGNNLTTLSGIGINIVASTASNNTFTGGIITGGSQVNSIGISTLADKTNLSNFNISGFRTGIQLSGSHFSILTNNTVNASTSSTSTYGIRLMSNSNNNTLLANTVNITGNSHGIYMDSGANNLVDCQGIGIIVGHNASNIYGLYEQSDNDTVQNCKFKNWYVPLRIQSAQNAFFYNNSAVGVTNAFISLYQNSSNGTMINNSFTNASTTGYNLVTGQHFIDCLGANNSGENKTNNNGVWIRGNSTTLRNCGFSNFDTGILLSGSQNDTILNNTVNGTYRYDFSAFQDSSGNPNGNNTVTGNNFTGNLWVNDSNSTDLFNTSSTGNIYYFKNGTGSWQQGAGSGGFDIWSSTSATWADSGTSRPFNATTVTPYWNGSGSDWWPYTLNITTAQASLFGMIGGPTGWSWGTYQAGSIIRRGGPTGWSWGTYTAGDGVLVINGSSQQSWSWVPE